MSSDSYYESIREDLIAHLQGMGGRVSGSNITKIVCPSCGKPEAWTKVADPATIHCNRGNHCGVRTHAKTFAPHLFGNWEKRHPPSKKDPKATARAYLKSRSLDPDKFGFEQGTWKEQGKTITTVAFQCSWTDRRWHRLLDIPKGIEGKTRWNKGEGEGYQGQAWTTGEIDPKKELWITEGIFEVLSLQQGANLQAAATFSASHIPAKFYDSLDPSQKIIIALNSDRAGQEGTEKNIQTLKDLGFKDVVAAQPPYGKDWNDLLVAGAFDEEKREQTIEKALWSGRLLRAESFKEYRKIYEENYKGEDGHYHGLLEYRGQTWFCGTKNLKEEVESTQTKVCDATVRRAFTQLVEEREYNAEHRYFLRINPVGRTTRIIEASAAELVNGNQARIMLKQRADVLLLDSSTPIINALVTRLEREKSPVVRMVDRLGYDKKSDCWLFGRFLYTSQGKRVEANEFGYFDQQQVRSKTSESIIDVIKPSDLKQAIQLLHRIYGNAGVYALAYYVVSLLKHDLMEQEHAFPYMSFVGPKGAGKTTLIYFLNNVFFQAWEGIVAAKNSTPKALARKLYHRSSLVAPYLESNNALVNIDENSLLNAYQGGSLYDRAAVSNDADTVSLPFDAALAFVQNVEPFRSGPLKERVITLSFQNAEGGGVTDDSIAAMNELKRIDTAARAGIGHQIFQNIQQIRDSILGNLDESRDEMHKAGINSPRVAYHYAVLGSTCEVLMRVAGFSEEESEDFKWAEGLAQLAMNRESTSGGENDVTLAFFDAFEQLREGVDDRYSQEKIKLEQGTHYLEDENHYYIRMQETIRVMKSVNYPIAPNIEDALKAADTWYVKQANTNGIGGQGRTGASEKKWKGGKKYRSWQFRKQPAQGTSGE